MKKETTAEIVILIACLIGSLFFALKFDILGFLGFIVANITSFCLFWWKALYILMLAQIIFLIIHFGGILGRL